MRLKFPRARNAPAGEIRRLRSWAAPFRYDGAVVFVWLVLVLRLL